jgi:hypothetical protein
VKATVYRRPARALRRMWFAQDSGFALGALPLGMGLPKRGW